MPAGNAEISIDWTIEVQFIIESLQIAKKYKGSSLALSAHLLCLLSLFLSPLCLALPRQLVKPPAINLYHHATSCSIIKNFSLVMRRLCRQLSLSQASVAPYPLSCPHLRVSNNNYNSDNNSCPPPRLAPKGSTHNTLGTSWQLSLNVVAVVHLKLHT